MKLHVSQQVESLDNELYLEDDGDKGRVEITVEVSKCGQYMKPVKAVEYWVQDEPHFEEGEDTLDPIEAINHFIQNVCVPKDCEHAQVNGKQVWSCFHEGLLYPLAIPQGENQVAFAELG